MQITFRYTDEEYIRSRRVNKLTGMPRWKSLAIALLCLLPSLVLVTFTGSFIAVAAFIIVAVFLIVLVAAAAIRQPTMTDKHDHEMTFSPQSLLEKSSHSQYELKWEHFDELIENDKDLLLRRIERYVFLPKRAFTAQQLETLRVYAEKVGGAISEDDQPVQLYERLLAESELDPVRFVYDPSDLVSANIDPLKIVDVSKMTASRAKPASNWLLAAWTAILLAVVMFVFNAPPGSNDRWNLIEFLILAGVIVLPFVLLILTSKWVRSRAAKNSPQTPPDEHDLVLLKSGFAIGTHKSVSFYDWRDVDAFYTNGSCYGFKTFNELIQVIPKRIFADSPAAESFFKQAIGLHREYRRSIEPSTTTIETGNPYQPPAG